jgi:hypothetical protein
MSLGLSGRTDECSRSRSWTSGFGNIGFWSDGRDGTHQASPIQRTLVCDDAPVDASPMWFAVLAFKMAYARPEPTQSPA